MGRKNFLDSIDYQSQIRLAIFLLVFFLVIFSLSSYYTFYQTQIALSTEFEERLIIIARLIVQDLIENKSRDILQNVESSIVIKSLRQNNAFKCISVLDSQEKILWHSVHNWKVGLKNEFFGLGKSDKQRILEGETVTSDFYTDKTGNYLKSCYISLFLKDSSKKHFIIRIDAEEPFMYITKKASTALTIMLISGIFGFVVLAFLSVRTILKPYSEMARAISQSSTQSSPDVETIVQTFKKTISELKAREEELKSILVLKERLAVVGEMSASMAHEFRNSLGTILGFVKLIEKSNLNNKDDELKKLQKSYIDDIIAEISNFETFINNFLVFTKPNAMHLSKVNIDDLIYNCVDILKKDAKTENINIEVNLKSSIPPIYVDEKLIKSAFMNIFNNSIEAMQSQKTEGKMQGILSIELSSQSENGTKLLMVKISDTGEGIEKENLDKIFNPFFTTKHSGTGLGLSISQKIIFEHHGTIKVESQKGKGTTFEIKLPINEL